MNEKETAAFAAIPKPPEGAGFRFSRVTTITEPHPYCITPRHVAHAADHHGGILGEAAIESAERSGARCGVSDCGLSYKNHVSSLAAVIVLPDGHPKDLNQIAGLGAYLSSVKEAATAAGIAGFMFPSESREVRMTR